MNSVPLALESPIVRAPQSPRSFSLPRSATFVEFPRAEIEHSIPARFEKQVEQYPDRIAVRARGAALTYSGLNQHANRLAHALLQRRELREEPVAFLLSHGIPQIIAILGILKAGKIYIPLDPSFPAPRLASILEDAGASVIITDEQNHTLARELAQNARDLLTLDDLKVALPTANPGLPISANTIVNIIYTSGSTGRPKGVIHNHRVMLHNIMSATNTYGISRDERLALLFSVGFSASFSPFFGALLNGATLLPYNLKDEGFAQLANWLMQEQVTIYDSVPSTFRRFVTALPETVQFPHLRLITLGGEPVYKRDVELYKKHFADDCLLCVRLAGTETRIICSWFIGKATQLETNVVPVGYADEGKEVLLLDDEGKKVASNQIGEIAVKSRHLATGYWRNPQLTHTVFQPSPDGGGEERIYHTGDLGRMRADGCLEHLGRKDSQVKIRGHRVEVGEVEMALLDLAGVREAAVTVKQDEAGRKYLVAYLAPRNSALPSVDVVRAALAQALPEYMIPSRFVPLEALPLTVTGKVDYRALPEPSRTRPELQTAFLAPRTAQETILQQIWQEVLEIEPVGVQDNFFDLGGDSLAVEEVLAQIEQKFHLTFPPDVFIQGPTIAALATLLHQPETPAVKSALVAIQPGGSKPPFFCASGYDGTALPLRRLGPHLAPDQPLYGLRDPRLEHKDVPFLTVENLASRYIEILRTHQPRGPYYVGGYSFGCLVAYEIAQQLQKAGQQVKGPIFLDLPSVSRPQGPGLVPRVQMDFIKQKGLFDTLKTIVRRLFMLTKRFTPSVAGSLSVREANILAKTAYRPQMYPGRVVFFQTKDNQDVPYLWEPLIAAGIEVHHVPGDHHTMLREPHLQILVDKLKPVLLQLQADM